MTRRERLENKLEKRHEWAGKADARSQQRFNAAGKLADAIPLGQPILCGHHSEGHARRDADRIANNMTKGCQEAELADYHEAKADGLAHQLDTTIFSDDAKAIEALEARIAKREREAEGYVSLNKAWRKAKGNVYAFAELAAITVPAAQHLAEQIERQYSWDRQPIPGYRLGNLRASIRHDQERIKQLKARIARSEKAESVGGILVQGDRYVSVTFAEKPDRAIIDALKAAGFIWSGGSWHGYRNNLPETLA